MEVNSRCYLSEEPPEGRQQKQEELQSYSLWNEKLHSQKDRQNEKAEDYVPDEGTI